MLNSLLKEHTKYYFSTREDHQFLVLRVDPSVYVVSKLEHYKGSYWFNSNGISVKADTVRCASLNDLESVRVQYRNEPLVRGIIGGYGVTNTPFVYVFWDRVPMKKGTFNFSSYTPNNGSQQGFPCALPDAYQLILE